MPGFEDDFSGGESHENKREGNLTPQNPPEPGSIPGVPKTPEQSMNQPPAPSAEQRPSQNPSEQIIGGPQPSNESDQGSSQQSQENNEVIGGIPKENPNTPQESNPEPIIGGANPPQEQAGSQSNPQPPEQKDPNENSFYQGAEKYQQTVGNKNLNPKPNIFKKAVNKIKGMAQGVGKKGGAGVAATTIAMTGAAGVDNATGGKVGEAAGNVAGVTRDIGEAGLEAAKTPYEKGFFDDRSRAAWTENKDGSNNDSQEQQQSQNEEQNQQDQERQGPNYTVRDANDNPISINGTPVVDGKQPVQQSENGINASIDHSPKASAEQQVNSPEQDQQENLQAAQQPSNPEQNPQK